MLIAQNISIFLKRRIDEAIFRDQGCSKIIQGFIDNEFS